MGIRHPGKTSAKLRHRHGLSLIEVMIGAVLLLIMGLAVGSLLTQNFRLSKVQSYRTQCVTTGLSLLEQIRFRSYNNVLVQHQLGAAGSFVVTVVDPTVAGGQRTINLPINVVDGAEVNAGWTNVDLYIDPALGTARLPARFYLSLNRNINATNVGTRIDAFEIVLICQWRSQGRVTDPWSTDNVRVVLANNNPINK